MGIRLAYSTLGTPGATLDDLLRLSAASGVRAVELRVGEGELVRPDMPLTEASATGRRLRDAGITVLALSSYVRICATADPDMPVPVGGDAVSTDLDRHLRLAAAVGAGGVRVFPQDDTPAAPASDGSPVDGGTPGEKRAAVRLQAVRPTIGETGVNVLVETHDSHRTGKDLARLLDLADVPGVLALWDTAHSWAAGEALADTFDLLAPRLAHIQIKDVSAGQDPTPLPLGTGNFPINDLGRMLSAAAWNGWASLEWERAWHPELPPLSDALATLPHWAGSLLEKEGPH
jgi:sugar phosphate isomerase/epimerase